LAIFSIFEAEVRLGALKILKKSFHHFFLTERPFDRTPFDRMPFDRKFIEPKKSFGRKQNISKGLLTENIWKMVI
jgi:hypothetical protein